MESFLLGLLSITFATSVLLLLLSNEAKKNVVFIVKLTISLWILQTIFTLLGHS